MENEIDMDESQRSKEKYWAFYKDSGTYVPLFAQPWFMDAVCGVDGWSVWMCEKGGSVYAALPYYLVDQQGMKKITKAPLAQINGLIFAYPRNQKLVKRQEFEEKIVNEAVDYIDSLGLDLYEQQYHYSFDNWLPFFWRNFTAVTRYTYVIEDTSDMDVVMNNYSPKLRSMIRKGSKSVSVVDADSKERFYELNSKVFSKQGLPMPFSYEIFSRLYDASSERGCSRALYAVDVDGNVHSLCFLIWDRESVYFLLGGSMPEFASSDSYSYLIHCGIRIASDLGRKFDFEGSVIKRISKSLRNFGGTAKPYFRIRRVYNPELVRSEAEDYIKRTSKVL